MPNTESHSDYYKNAGVDVTAGYRGVSLIKEIVGKTFASDADEGARRGKVLGGIGDFGGIFQPSLEGLAEPVLVAGTDGVGTKLKIAFSLNRHDTIGIDCVAMCVNDIVCSGARPLFFLDYIALGKNEPEKVASIVKGIAEGCVQAGCALLGGETAEMPGMYSGGEYDVAGFTVGIADKARLPDKSAVRPGDAFIGLASSGPHSNGYSLIRQTLSRLGLSLHQSFDGSGTTLGDALLAPTRIYVRAALALFDSGLAKSACNITGGGFYENIPRALPAGVRVRIEKANVKVPPVLSCIQEKGQIPERDMYNVFNMGLGFGFFTSPENAAKALDILNAAGETAFIAGEVQPAKDSNAPPEVEIV